MHSYSTDSTGYSTMYSYSAVCELLIVWKQAPFQLLDSLFIILDLACYWSVILTRDRLTLRHVTSMADKAVCPVASPPFLSLIIRP